MSRKRSIDEITDDDLALLSKEIQNIDIHENPWKSCESKRKRVNLCYSFNMNTEFLQDENIYIPTLGSCNGFDNHAGLHLSWY